MLLCYLSISKQGEANATLKCGCCEILTVGTVQKVWSCCLSPRTKGLWPGWFLSPTAAYALMILWHYPKILLRELLQLPFVDINVCFWQHSESFMNLWCAPDSSLFWVPGFLGGGLMCFPLKCWPWHDERHACFSRLFEKQCKHCLSQIFSLFEFKSSPTSLFNQSVCHLRSFKGVDYTYLVSHDFR